MWFALPRLAGRHLGLRASAIVAVAGVVAVLGGSARAQSANAPLAGEDLSAVTPGIFANVNCNPEDTSTFTFKAEGIATGPYPGTFREMGTIHLGPLVSIGSTNFGFDTGPVTLFDAHFRIESGSTVVTGTKRLAGEPSFDLGQGTCTNFQNLSIRVGQTTIVNASGTYLNFSARAAYDATISSPTGTTQVEGLAFAQGSQLDVTGTCLELQVVCERHLGAFRETFITSQPKEPPPPPPPEPAALFLSPKAATNEIRTTHTVTAEVVGAAPLPQPIANETVRFEVTGSVEATGSCNTGPDGTCSFTYQGPDFPGADLIRAYVDEDNDRTQDPGEPQDEATKEWVLTIPLPGHVTGGGRIPTDDLSGEISFGFNAHNFLPEPGMHARCTLVDRSTDTMIKCLDAIVVAQSPTHATFSGNALVNGVATRYTIDVDDLGEGDGALLQDMFKIQTDNGYSAAGFLTAGNIQIH
jgi:hypothetical protein